MKLVIKRSDGGVSIAPYTDGMDVEKFIADWEAGANPNLPGRPELNLGTALGHEIADDSSIPADRTFRNAWSCTAKTVVHDMAKCREIHKNRLRLLRTPLLEAADVEYMRALETGDAVAQETIAARKRALRDVTADPAITAATTPDELKAVLPEVLKR